MSTEKPCGRKAKHGKHMWLDGGAREGLSYCLGLVEGEEQAVFPEPASIPQEAIEAYLKSIDFTYAETPEYMIDDARVAISDIVKVLVAAGLVSP